jgi:hypothetical protein
VNKFLVSLHQIIGQKGVGMADPNEEKFKLSKVFRFVLPPTSARNCNQSSCKNHPFLFQLNERNLLFQPTRLCRAVQGNNCIFFHWKFIFILFITEDVFEFELVALLFFRLFSFQLVFYYFPSFFTFCERVYVWVLQNLLLVFCFPRKV